MPEPVTPTSPRPIRRSMLVQRWQDLAFLHWAVDPAEVRPHLPRGIVPDVIDGVSHVGLIGFRMVGLGLLAGPGLPWLGTFCETNVRLYGVDDQGRRSVVFCSLDAARLIPVLVARVTLELPYVWSRMRLRHEGDLLTYTSRRRWPGPRGAANRMVIRPGERIVEPTDLELFLTARWGLHVTSHGRVLHLPNVHESWPLHRAELLELSDDLVAAAGLPRPSGPPVSVLHSPGVNVRFGPAESMGAARARTAH